jgi:hypothetical protein
MPLVPNRIVSHGKSFISLGPNTFQAHTLSMCGRRESGRLAPNARICRIGFLPPCNCQTAVQRFEHRIFDAESIPCSLAEATSLFGHWFLTIQAKWPLTSYYSTPPGFSLPHQYLTFEHLRIPSNMFSGTSTRTMCHPLAFDTASAAGWVK